MTSTKAAVSNSQASMRNCRTMHPCEAPMLRITPNLAATGVAAYPEGAHHAQEDAEQGETRQGVLQAELVGDTTLHGIVLAQLRKFLQAVEVEVAYRELRRHFLLETLLELSSENSFRLSK